MFSGSFFHPQTLVFRLLLDLGPIDIGPTDTTLKVADFEMGENHDTLWLRITQESPASGWDFSYALCWWQSSVGRELGTTKIYSHRESEIFILGMNRQPSVRNGAIYIKPRAYNLAWVRASSPPIWTLRFEALSGKIATAPVPEPVPEAAVAASFADSRDDDGLELVRVVFPTP